ncbi:hypothetical protein THAOC_16999, partial [Thalassiosira oceanica]
MIQARTRLRGVTDATTCGGGFLASSLQTVASIFGFVAYWAIHGRTSCLLAQSEDSKAAVVGEMVGMDERRSPGNRQLALRLLSTSPSQLSEGSPLPLRRSRGRWRRRRTGMAWQRRLKLRMFSLGGERRVESNADGPSKPSIRQECAANQLFNKHEPHLHGRSKAKQPNLGRDAAAVVASFQKASRPGMELRLRDVTDATTCGGGFLASSLQTVASIFGFVAYWAIHGR